MMLFELIFVAAFALFALFAWMAITATRERAEFYRGCYQECMNELEYRREFQASDSATISRMWEELDRRRLEAKDAEMEAKHAEYQLQDAFEGYDAPEDETAEYRPTRALETDACMTTGEDLCGEKIMRAAEEAARSLGYREKGMFYCGELPDCAPEGEYYAILEDGSMVRGEYPEGTEAIVAASEDGGLVRHYQHFV